MTQEKTEPTFKRLKITDTKGVVNYVPLNKTNENFYSEHKKKLSAEKREKFKIEEVELSLHEAAELGIYEAYEILNPPKKKGQVSQQSNDVMAMLMSQNQALMERLAVLESKETPKKEPVKK
jgi:hypothetical protein